VPIGGDRLRQLAGLEAKHLLGLRRLGFELFHFAGRDVHAVLPAELLVHLVALVPGEPRLILRLLADRLLKAVGRQLLEGADDVPAIAVDVALFLHAFRDVNLRARRILAKQLRHHLFWNAIL
jgi:hypothetical protein